MSHFFFLNFFLGAECLGFCSLWFELDFLLEKDKA